MGGKTSSESINKYMAKAYDRITVSVPKGERETLKAIVTTAGLTLSQYFVLAVQEKMERDTQK